MIVALCIGMISGSSVRAEEGISQQVKSSVDRGLAYLAKKQLPDGTFPSSYHTAVTALSVTAFLSRGHVPGQGPYGQQINQGIDAILTSQKKDGLISQDGGNAVMYDHGIATVMLCEVCGMVDEGRHQKIDTAIAKAVKLIIQAQRMEKYEIYKGGWRYQPTSNDSDMSVTGWQLMALRGAANIGAAVPAPTLKDGLDYIRRHASPSGGFGYMGSDHPTEACTGTGILSLELLGQHESKEALAGGDYLLQSAHSHGNDHYYYAIYYCSQAANQLGGKYWEGIYKPLRDTLLARQKADGSWPLIGGEDNQAGEAYCTAMAVLALTVPMHYLPLYQK